jgi:hypothetical protein
LVGVSTPLPPLALQFFCRGVAPRHIPSNKNFERSEYASQISKAL